ncbi:hypothetical protein C791_7844 [Amycolatopsis azurea DSM 43854]|uniref:Uncharacterized protein n=1 Tax=Amycolatopsis azurea DSM 43854 TaxID=1238180 RepID=M2QA88_9PSEU|nr:hypothetical protein C791_7844 [Amycolatopsis azurea DSM 43854]
MAPRSPVQPGLSSEVTCFRGSRRHSRGWWRRQHRNIPRTDRSGCCGRARRGGHRLDSADADHGDQHESHCSDGVRSPRGARHPEHRWFPSSCTALVKPYQSRSAPDPRSGGPHPR